MKQWLGMVAISFLVFLNAGHAEEAPSADLPPVASFTFAGPVTEGTAVRFRYVLALHSIQVDRIQILDANTEQVIVDDAGPNLAPSTLKIKSAPSIVVKQWEGFSKAETVTESSPSWLHEKSNTAVLLEARLFKSGKLVFSTKQAASYSYSSKKSALMAVDYNRQLASGEAAPSSIRTVANARLQSDVTRSVGNYEAAAGGSAKVVLVAAKMLGKEGQAFVEQWTFEAGSKKVDYRVTFVQSASGGVDFSVTKIK